MEPFGIASAHELVAGRAALVRSVSQEPPVLTCLADATAPPAAPDSWSRLVVFLGTIVGVSLSGVMAPGPVTAATLAAGTRSRHAGAMIAVGHGIVEFPLMLLVMAGMNRLLQMKGVTIAIGLVGGLFLVHMGTQMLRDLGRDGGQTAQAPARHPLWTGVVLTGNPYFLLWRATVGLTLAGQAIELGVLAFALFAIVHWLCDLVWLEVLSWSSFKGTGVFGPRSQRIVLGVCGAALILIGFRFVLDAARQGGFG